MKNIQLNYYKLNPITRKLLVLLVISLALFLCVTVPRLAVAQSTGEKIRTLENQNKANQQAVLGLKNTAASYQDAISKFQAQIDVLQEQISANEAEKASLEQQIIVAQEELDRQKKVLGTNIKSMYVNSEMSTIEMLATSKDLSDFVDKDTYRNSVQRQIQETMAKITKLQDELTAKKKQIDDLLATLSSQRATLDAARGEQANLLAMNQQQQAEYNQQTKANQAELLALRKQQAEETRRFLLAAGGTQIRGAACGGTYPTYLCGRAQDSVFDDWGMYNRQCVSYAAWKVHEAAGYMPKWGGKYSNGYWGGNASAWAHNARLDGYRVDKDPNGSVVVAVNRDASSVANAKERPGHVMFVEGVNSNGTINISQYNANATGPNYDNDGTYSEVKGMSTSGLTFIHFR